MNEYEIDEARALLVQFQERSGEAYPNLTEAALTLERLKRWTNQHSDGWMYWGKPSQAAARLIEALSNLKGRYIRDELVDITDAELAACYKPIKAFLTRQHADHEAVFPTPPTEEEITWEAWHDLLHGAASQMAADALNNGEGKAFLMMNGWSEQEIDEALAYRVKEQRT